jgi:hypothetical protein
VEAPKGDFPFFHFFRGRLETKRKFEKRKKERKLFERQPWNKKVHRISMTRQSRRSPVPAMSRFSPHPRLKINFFKTFALGLAFSRNLMKN